LIKIGLEKNNLGLSYKIHSPKRIVSHHYSISFSKTSAISFSTKEIETSFF
jgi:hypothetical protein